MLVILLLLSLLSPVFCQDVEDGALLSNETTDENLRTESTTVQDVGEADCGNPPVIAHAEYERRSVTELKYSCEFGYSADAIHYVSHCREGSWTDPGITCIPRSCGDPGFVLNAQRIGSRFTFPNEVHYECDEGYAMEGGSVRYCQVNGKWSGSLPSCRKIFCDPPSHPENGRVIYSSLEFGSQLKYECEKGFILKNRTRVCTENGTWSGPEPSCLEAQCEQPDAPEHGSVEVVGGRVGSIAIFKCEVGRTLVGSGTSKCLDIGEWTFPAPKCVEPCIVPNVAHGMIGRYEKKRWSWQKTFTLLPEGTSLKDGEELYLRCDARYEPLGENRTEKKISCEKGFWPETPACVPAKCRSDPPVVKNSIGRSVKGRNHGEYVVYYCAPHFKKKPGNVTCHFGTWKGVPPTCSNKSCYVDRIQFQGVVKKGKKNRFRNGEVFKIECERGYNVTGSELLCDDGTWKGHDPPCRAANCSTSPPPIENGRVRSSTGLHSSVVSYECDQHYFLLQHSSHVQCLFGEWKGTPPTCKEDTCLIEQISNGFFTQRLSRRVWTGRGYLTEYHFQEALSEVSPREELYVACRSPYTVEGKNESIVPVHCSEGRWKPSPVCLLPPRDCYCLYQGSEDLVAYSGHTLLESGSRVEVNASVKFYCRHFGYHRFMGQREIFCRTCKPWHSSEYPSCVLPVRGDVIIQLDENQTILPGGIITIEHGVDAQISCATAGIADYPIWESTVAIDHPSHRYVDPSSGRYYSVLLIRNASSRHTGYYSCSVAGKRAREIQLCIHIQCKKFDESDGLTVHYDKGQEVNSRALFTCRDPDRKLEGPANVLTCLSNGEWTGRPPTCVLPSRCALEKLLEHIPENVVPHMEGVTSDAVPPGFELPLTCEGRLSEAVARCGRDGTWTVPKVNCVMGCGPLQLPPGLIVLPEMRDSYRLGESVTLECALPGHVLSNEVEMVMCLSSGWSETALPLCLLVE